MNGSEGFLWNGYKYAIEEKSFFGRFLPFRIYFHAKAGLAELSYEPITFKLPRNSSYLIKRDFRAVQGWKEDFQDMSEWDDFQSRLCDQYCEHLILGAATDENIYRLSWGPGQTIPMTHWVAIHAFAKGYPSFVVNSSQPVVPIG